MKTKQIEFYEVSIKFLVRKDSYNAKDKSSLKELVENGIGGNDMDCIEAENIEVQVK